MTIKNHSDEEIVDLILENFKEDGRINANFIHVECVNGRPVISGRVASDDELQIIEEVLIDVLDVTDYENNVWVDDTLAFKDAEEEGEEVEELNMDDNASIDDGSPFGSDDDENQ